MCEVLVVAILNREFDRGRVHRVRQKLQELPNELVDLFREIITREGELSEDTELCVM
jgi:hypothetical protein